MKYLVYLIYPVMLFILHFGVKIYKRGEWNDEFLGFKQTKAFQGFLAICIMLHHIGQEMCASWQNYPIFEGLEFFVPLGPTLVGMFLLFSGYGLYISFQNKPNYLDKGFFRKRVLPLIVGYYASAWIFLIVRILMHQPMNPWRVFCFIIGIKLANPYSWFAFSMPLFYLFFYLAFKYNKKNPILIVTLCIFGYTFLGTCINHNNYLMTGQWWYNCVHLFWIGLLIAKYQKRIVAWAKRLYGLKLIIAIVLIPFTWTISQMMQGRFSYYGENIPGLPVYLVIAFRWICLIAEMLATTNICLACLLLGMKARIGNRFLGFMGTITFEFYIIHGLPIELFSYRFCDVTEPIVRITNVALMIVVIFVTSIPLSLVMKKICHIFDSKLK